ncbi:MAG: amino acid racemase [Proteobacteria bacterium]|nr:amino acid racemase [Cystobacterineae bacterium]MCL2259700.1 amino acid racemase [Cystobacterineae bacterium]MCL2313706.1 amino acid racemase [Pseudomonadota bacterium]
MNKTKKVGIVGGIGPASTLDYYSGIIHGVRQRTKGDGYPEILINSIDMTEMLSFLKNREWEGLIQRLLRAIQNLADAGAEFAAIASNTPHVVFDEVQSLSALPLVSIVEATCKYAQAKGCKRAVILGTRFTMSSGMYSAAFAQHGMVAVAPPEAVQTAIDGLIFPKLEEGILVPEDKLRMVEMAGGLLEEHHADSLLLGCTELPLMLKDGDLDTLMLNTTQIHIEAIVHYSTMATLEQPRR